MNRNQESDYVKVKSKSDFNFVTILACRLLQCSAKYTVSFVCHVPPFVSVFFTNKFAQFSI